MKPPTSGHKHWRGHLVDGHPDYPYNYDYRDEDGIVWMRYHDNPLAIPLGTAPMPRNRWEWFWFDIHHGMLMHFGLMNVLSFSFNQLLRRKRHGRSESSEEALNAAS